MFRLFSSIFGKSGAPLPAGISEALLQEGIERVVDSTDPRIRILPDYKTVLREPVIRAIEHVIGMVQRLDAPVAASQAGRESSPVLCTLFTSTPRMLEILAQDSTLRKYLATPRAGTMAYGLLVAQRNERTGFGYALVDDKVMNDVRQTTVSFDEQRLLDLSGSEQDTRRMLMRRAFDYVLSIALSHVTEQRDMGPQDRATLQARLDDVETQLAAQGGVVDMRDGLCQWHVML